MFLSQDLVYNSLYCMVKSELLFYFWSNSARRLWIWEAWLAILSRRLESREGSKTTDSDEAVKLRRRGIGLAKLEEEGVG